MFNYTLFQIIDTILVIYSIVVVLRVLISLLGVSLAHPVADFIYRITEPFLAPIRNRMPLMGPFDFSPMVLLLIIWLIQRVLFLVFRWLV